MDPWLTLLTNSEQMDIVSIYLHMLTSGYTLLGFPIQLSTLKEYMNVIAKWVQPHVRRDIRYHPTIALSDAFSDCWEHHPMFRNIYADTKAWQGIPNRKNPVTKSMIDYLRSTTSNPYSLTNALIDFSVCACQTGWRGIKWLQPVNLQRSGELKFYKYDAASSKFENMIYACCREDFRFKHQCGKRIKDPFLVPINEVMVCTVYWQFQKNLQHSQEIDFQASPNAPEWCFVWAILWIIKRFNLFCGRPNTPVALYLHNPGSAACDWLTKRNVESKLRLAAWKVVYPDRTWDKSLAKNPLTVSESGQQYYYSKQKHWKQSSRKITISIQLLQRILS